MAKNRLPKNPVQSSRKMDASSPPAESTIGPRMLRAGAAFMIALLIAGLARSLVKHGSLPSVHIGYMNELNEITQQSPAVAIPKIRSAMEIDFDSEQAAVCLLEVARQNGDADAMLSALQHLVRFRKEDAQVRSELVSALLLQGRVGEAYQHGLIAIRLNPTSATAYSDCGAALLGMDRKREAATYYRKALELDPNLEAARLALEYPLRGY